MSEEGIAAEKESSCQVLWFDLSSSGYPWWPCRVEDDCLVSFEDNWEYDFGNVKESKLKSYTSNDIPKLIKKGVRKLRKRKDQSEMYLNAIEKAVQYIRSNIDQDYCLQVDSNCYPGSSVLTHRGPAASKTVLTEQTSESNHQEDAARSRLSNGNCNGKTCDEKQLITEDKPEQPIIVNFSQARKSSVPVRPVRPVKRKRERKRKEDSSTPCSAEVIETDLTPTNPKKLKTESPLVEDLKQDSCTPSPILSAWLSSTPVSHLTTMIDSGDDLEVNSESDSDDDLPVVDLSMKETVGLIEFQPRDLVWVKCQRWPYWPALVTEVKKTVKANKKKVNVAVLFFGYDDKMKLKVTIKKNIVPFGTKKFEEYVKEGMAFPKERKQFDQAVKEARDLVRDMAEGVYKNMSDPKEVFQKVISNRPEGYDFTHIDFNFPEEDDSDKEDSKEGSVDVEKEEVPLLCLTGDHSEDEEELEEEEDNETPLYTYDEVASEVRKISSILEDIAREKETSHFHEVFVRGSRKQRSSLKFGKKFGPVLKGWKQEQIDQLINKELLMVAKRVGYDFSYTFDVLLPEAMVRLLARFDNISYDAALEKFFS